MNQKKTVAARDADGNLWWFYAAEAKRWSATQGIGGELYWVADRWVLVPALADLNGEPARVVDDQEALSWLTQNAYSPPSELAEYAESRRLR